MATLHAFKRQFALVVGDIMMDKYIFGDVERISPEAPVPVLLQRKTDRKVGGCGNVAMNILSLGARVRVAAAVGEDTEGALLKSMMEQAGVDVNYILPVSGMPTITKTRVVSRNQQFLRIDDEVPNAPPGALDRLRASLHQLFDGITVVVLSDYAKGFLSREICQLIIGESTRRAIPVIVDPKGKDCSKYHGATAVTPNTKEFVDLTNVGADKEPSTFLAQGLGLCRENDLRYLFVTRSEQGISVIDAQAGTKSDFPTLAKEVIDVTGAGDTVVAVLSLAFGSGIEAGECAVLSNHAASIVVSKFGVAQATYDELAAATNFGIRSENGTAVEEIARLRLGGKKIVFTNGCFDIVHAGHISSFKQARRLGDILVVGINSDESIKRIKGDKRPIISLEHRKQLLSSIRYVDYVIPFHEDTPENLIRDICPHVMVKGIEWKGREVAGSEFVNSYGGQMEYLPLEEGLSTTEIINRIRLAYGENQ